MKEDTKITLLVILFFTGLFLSIFLIVALMLWCEQGIDTMTFFEYVKNNVITAVQSIKYFFGRLI